MSAVNLQRFAASVLLSVDNGAPLEELQWLEAHCEVNSLDRSHTAKQRIWYRSCATVVRLVVEKRFMSTDPLLPE